MEGTERAARSRAAATGGRGRLGGGVGARPPDPPAGGGARSGKGEAARGASWGGWRRRGKTSAGTKAELQAGGGVGCGRER